ncbi:UNVERIFIED_CONTAM: hypothetical protein K2H54_028776 [Gekko kuhli]
MIWESGSKRSGTPESHLPQSWGGKPAGGREEKPWGGGGRVVPVKSHAAHNARVPAEARIACHYSDSKPRHRSQEVFYFWTETHDNIWITQTNTGVELLVEGPLNVACEGNVPEDLYFPQVLHDPLS